MFVPSLVFVFGDDLLGTGGDGEVGFWADGFDHLVALNPN